MRQANRRVVVTGMGMVTPVGKDMESSWRSLREGRGGVGAVTLFDASTFATRIAAEIENFRLEDYRTDADQWAHHGRTSQLSLAAATMAVEHSGLEEARLDRTRFGIYLGSGEGQQDFERFVDVMHRACRDGRADPARFMSLGLKTFLSVKEADQEPGAPAGHLAGVFGASGPNATCQTACSASAQAIGEATELIRRGDADVMLAGERIA